MAGEGDDSLPAASQQAAPPPAAPAASTSASGNPTTSASNHPAGALDGPGRTQYIRGLFGQANDVVAQVTAGMGRGDDDHDELRHHIDEMAALADDIAHFPISLLASSARGATSKEAARAVAALNTAGQMLEARCQAIQNRSGVRRSSTPAPTGGGGGGSRNGRGSSSSRRRSRSTGSGGANGNRGAGNTTRGSPADRNVTPPNNNNPPARSTGARLLAMASADPQSSSSLQRGGANGVQNSASTTTAAGGVPTTSAQNAGPSPWLPGQTPGGATGGAPSGFVTARGSGWAIPALSGQGLARPQSSAMTGTGGNASPLITPPAPPMPTNGAWAAPSWLSNTAVPFAPAMSTLGPEYYLSFPYPWNGVPQQREAAANDIVKLSANKLPKFNGDRRVYIAWRSSFIPAVHLTTLDISYKLLLLRSSMETHTRRMKEFVESLMGTPEGYRQAVVTLEERYGGSAALLMTRQEAILTLPDLKAGDFFNLETLHTRLNTYLLEWEGIMGAPMTERETITFYTTLMGKLESAYARQYMTWVDTTGKRENLQAFQMWLAEELRRHRQVDIYERSKSGTLGKGGASRPPFDVQAQRRPPQLPAPSQIAPFPRQRGFCAAEDGEEVREGDEEAVEQVCVGLQEKAVLRPARPACSLCQEDHGLGKCPKFRSMTPQERKAVLVRERRCFLCFQKNHSVSRCTFQFACMQCGKRHHTLIHGAETVVAGRTLLTLEEEAEDAEGAAEALSFGLVARPSQTHVQAQRVSLRTAPVLVINPLTGRAVLANAMLDDGCTAASMVSVELAERLQLTGQKKWTRTEGVGGHVTHYQTLLTCVRVLNPDTKQGRLLPAQVMDKPAGTYSPVDWNQYKHRFPHLKALDFPRPVPGAGVDIMLGNQCAALTASLKEVIGLENEPVARNTPLGWTAVGPVLPGLASEQIRAQLSFFSKGVLTPLEVTTSKAVESTVGSFLSRGEDRLLTKLLDRMLRVEDPGEAEVLSPKEQYIVQQAQQSLVQVGRQYQVGCTWAPGGGRPPLNLTQARTRLNLLEKGKHFRNPEVAAAYGRVIQQWEKEGFVRQVQFPSEQVAHLLPHFPVLKESKSTPVRPVMDCSVSLNRYLLAGPSLINEVLVVLLRFRSGLFSFSGDVQQMFLRILLAPPDRPYHCFLWKGDRREPVVFQFQVHVFGNAGSPFLAVFVVREHARGYQNKHPAAVDTLFHSTLIDDVLDSADTECEAASILGSVRSILADAGMRLTKCHSNSAKVLATLSPGEVASGLLDFSGSTFTTPEESDLKTLGLTYSSQRDCFLFSMQAEGGKDWSKRAILRVFPRLFDPLGLLLPFTMIARNIFSSAARLAIGWDAPLPSSLQTEWNKWLVQLPQLGLCSFPRCVKVAVPDNTQLHVFADASAFAFAAVAYLRCRYSDRAPTSRLVAARARVVPLGKHSVPRLELLAADLAVTLRRQVQQALKVRIDSTYHWSDSSSVLYWLNNDKDRMQLFVYNRVTRIRRGTDLSEWGWVPSDLNPADLPTRGISVVQLAQSTLWAHGPAFLQEDANQWPKLPKLLPSSAILREMKKEEQVMVSHRTPGEQVIDWKCFSSWTKFRRMVCRVLLARDRARHRLDLPPLEPAWQRAEWALLRQAQLTLAPTGAPGGEKEHWKAQGFVRLSAFRDERGLWRGYGRLSHAQALPRDVREPFLLPKNHRAAHLLILHLHEEVLFHAGGVSYVLARLQTRFWLPAARTLVYQILSHCVPCRRRRATPSRPPPGPLPNFRIPQPSTDARPFAVTAVDCAGPFRVKRGRSQEMYYLLLITCCSLRAVRLELLSDLSVDAFLLALTRASSRGVHPHTVLSDNGGNFVSADRLLRQLWEALPQQQLMQKAPHIQWRFNPPYASHYGGVFERLIRAAKEALYHVLPSTVSLSLEQLYTSFAVVEAILNSRPLTYVSNDPMDLVPLTPNHFLYGASSLPLFFPEANTSLAKRWSSLQQWTVSFQQAFAKQVRPHLQLATKKRAAGRDLQVGDVVTFFMPSASPSWQLARIERVFPGQDKRVRTVELRVPGQAHLGRNLRRDVGSVALLLPAEDKIHPSFI